MSADSSAASENSSPIDPENELSSVHSSPDTMDDLSVSETKMLETAFVQLLNALHDGMTSTCRSMSTEEALEILSDRLQELRTYGGQLACDQPHLVPQIDLQIELMQRSYEEVCNLHRKSSAGASQSLNSGAMSSLMQWQTWLSLIEYKLESVNAYSWEEYDSDEFEKQLQDRELLQKEIEQSGRMLFAKAQKELESLQDAPTRLQRLFICLQRRWHSVWLNSLEMICRLKDVSKNNLMYASGLSDSLEFQPSSMKRFCPAESSALQLALDDELYAADVGYSSGNSARSMQTTESNEDYDAQYCTTWPKAKGAKSKLTLVDNHHLSCSLLLTNSDECVSNDPGRTGDEFFICSTPANVARVIVDANCREVEETEQTFAKDPTAAAPTQASGAKRLNKLTRTLYDESDGLDLLRMSINASSARNRRCQLSTGNVATEMLNNSSPDLRRPRCLQVVEKRWQSSCTIGNINSPVVKASAVIKNKKKFADFMKQLLSRLDEARRVFNCPSPGSQCEQTICKAFTSFIFLYSSRVSDLDLSLMHHSPSGLRRMVHALDDWLKLLIEFCQRYSTCDDWCSLQYPVQVMLDETIDLTNHMLRLLADEWQEEVRENANILQCILSESENLRNTIRPVEANGHCLRAIDAPEEDEAKWHTFDERQWNLKQLVTNTGVAMLMLLACFVLLASLGFYAINMPLCCSDSNVYEFGLRPTLSYVNGLPPT